MSEHPSSLKRLSTRYKIKEATQFLYLTSKFRNHTTAFVMTKKIACIPLLCTRCCVVRLQNFRKPLYTRQEKKAINKKGRTSLNVEFHLFLGVTRLGLQRSLDRPLWIRVTTFRNETSFHAEHNSVPFFRDLTSQRNCV